MTGRDELEAALAKAEAALVEAVLGSAKAGSHSAEIDANLEKTRAYCRQARAALVELDRSESTGISADGFDTLIRRLGEVSGRRAAATQPSTQSDKQAVAAQNRRSGDKSNRQEPIRQIDRTLATAALIRHTIGLFALTLAYLQFYFFEVQLQILGLPSITVFLVQ